MNLIPARRLLAPLLALAGALAFSGAAQARSLLNCSTLPDLMVRYQTLHVSQLAANDAAAKKARDAELMERTAELYLKRYDSAKTLLTQAEADALKAEVKQFFANAIEGKCGSLQGHLAMQVARHAAQEDAMKAIVEAKDFAIDRTIELVMDADKRPRPTTTTEQAALRRKLAHFQMASYVASGSSLDEARTKLEKRYALITKRVKEIDESDLLSSLLDAYANAFDPHTTYFSAEALEDFRIGMQLSLEGIGAVLRSRDGYTMVYEIVKGGAADRQGQLRTKDRIIAVAQQDGEPVDVVDMALSDVVRFIRGPKGTEVKLTVLRQGEKTETLNITIVRDTIDLKEQAAKVRYEEVEREGRKLKMAIIDLPSFYGSSSPGGRQCADDVAALLEEVKGQNVDGLVLDLSENSGGLLQHAVDITGFFLRRGTVVSIEGSDHEPKQLKDVDQNIQYNGPLVVLTSRLSASASEILAGAVKDYARGLIVGDDQTFGKGTVQNVVNLPEGFGALKVTTALFFRPGGDSTQQKGVAADIVVTSPYNSEQFGEKNQDYSLPPQKTRPFKDDTVNIPGPEGWKAVTAEIVADTGRAQPQAGRGLRGVQEGVRRPQEGPGARGRAQGGRDPRRQGRKGEDEDEPKKDDGKLTPRPARGSSPRRPGDGPGRAGGAGHREAGSEHEHHQRP
ncbi:MAG: S41 family peptidase [bacterium]